MQLLRSLLRLAPRARPDAPAPDDHRRAARLTGVLYGALQLGALFPGLVITVLADEIGTSDDTVQLVLGLTAAAGVLVTGYWLARGASLQSRGRLAGSVLVFGAALVGLDG